MRLLFFICVVVCALMPLGSQAQASGQQPDSASVVIHGDPRLELLTRRHMAPAPGSGRSGGIRSQRGYRVQIYSGTDRAKANQIRLDFMRRFPGHRTYITYVQPHFRVKAGDFRTRAEAAGLYNQVNGIYTPCMIVPDIVVINTIKHD